MTAAIDGLVSPTLKKLRERWWDDEFTEFMAETLRPRPGNRILDVGCGEGLAEVNIGRLQISQVELVGTDVSFDKLVRAREETRSHNQRVGFAAGDARRLPFRDASFDALFSVAILQRVGDVDEAVGEFARVTAPGGRIVAVEPDNSARYFYSSASAGLQAFASASRLFSSLAASRGETSDDAIGPRLPAMFVRHGIEPVDVRLFPVSHAWLGTPAAGVWDARRKAIERLLPLAPDENLRRAGHDSLEALEVYRSEAVAAGPAFVEMQNVLLFATVGQREE
jgi:SAM-dependent methyltransferase